MKRQRLSPAETRRIIDSYTFYRFGNRLSPADLAKQAGVESRAIDDLLAQQTIPEADLNRIARAIDVSPRHLSEIAGCQDISSDTRMSLDRCFGALRHQPKRKAA